MRIYCNELISLQIKETAQRTRNLLENEVYPAVSQLAECLADWYKMAQTVYQQSEILDSEIDNYEAKLHEYINKINNNDINFHDGLTNISKVICTANSKHGGRVKAQDTKKYRTILNDIKLTEEEIESVLNGNTKLVRELHSITNGNNDENSAGKNN